MINTGERSRISVAISAGHRRDGLSPSVCRAVMGGIARRCDLRRLQESVAEFGRFPASGAERRRRRLVGGRQGLQVCSVLDDGNVAGAGHRRRRRRGHGVEGWRVVEHFALGLHR